MAVTVRKRWLRFSQYYLHSGDLNVSTFSTHNQPEAKGSFNNISSSDTSVDLNRKSNIMWFDNTIYFIFLIMDKI